MKRKKTKSAEKIVFLEPCPKCGCPTSVDNRKRYVYCRTGHYSRKLFGATPYTKFVARSLTAQEAEFRQRDTATWRRLKKT